MGTWSRRDVNHLRAQMAEQGRDVDEIAEEIRHLTGCSRLAAYRMAHGLSQPEAAQRHTSVVPDAVMDQPLLSRLEMFPAAGSRSPQAAQIITFATVYGTVPLRLLSPQALDQLDSRERAVLIRCNAAFAGPPALPGPGESADAGPAARTLAAGGAGDVDRQVEMAARRALRFAVIVEGSNVGPQTLDQLRDETARLARAYPQQPLPLLLTDLIDVQEVAFRLMEGRQRPAEAREMYLLTGVICGMLAKASHDLGNPHSAMTQARTAYVCADNAGHDGLRAWTRGLQSLIAYWAGWPHEAARYAEHGREPAGRAAGTAAVWLAAQEARTWAVLGDAGQAQAAIARASDARDHARPNDLDALGGIMTFTRPRQLYYAADALVWLPGMEQRGEHAATEAVDAYEHAGEAELSFSDEAGARADQALARAHRGDLEGAAESLRPVLELPPTQRIGGITVSVMRVHTALRAPALTAATQAKDLRMEIESYCQARPTPALPKGR